MILNPPSIIEVQVTQVEIDAGVQCDACACPVALSLKRDGWSGVAVGPNTAIEDCEWESAAAASFTAAFDDGRPVSPCTLVFTRVEE